MKQTLMEVKSHHHFDTAELLKQSGVGDRIVFDMLVGNPVQHQQAEKVLQTLSTLIGIPCTLDTVMIAIQDEPQDETDTTQQKKENE